MVLVLEAQRGCFVACFGAIAGSIGSEAGCLELLEVMIHQQHVTHGDIYSDR